MPRKPYQTRIYRRTEPSGKTTQLHTTCHPRNSTAHQLIQRGTNRPVGKREKTRNSKTKASTPSILAGICQMEGIVSNGLIVLLAPCVTNTKATSKAIQSLDLRQKISRATRNQIKAITTPKASKKIA